MNKILTICITYHGEPKNKIIPLLQTLDAQIGNVFDKVKFILSNNSDIPTDYQLFSEYKNILPHCIFVNCSECLTIAEHRNYLINFVATPYFCFIDCDDRICGCTTILEILSAINDNPDVDILQFTALRWEKQNSFATWNMAVPGGWGCVFKKECWIKNKLHYPTNIQTQEDIFIYYCTYFNPNIIKKEFKDINFICYCVWQDTTGASYFKNNSIFNQQISDTMQLLIDVKNYYHDFNLIIDYQKMLFNELQQFYWKLIIFENNQGKLCDEIRTQIELKLKEFYKNKFTAKDLLTYSDITGRISNISNVGYNISFQDWANNILED